MGAEMSVVNPGDKVTVVRDAAKLQRMVENCEDLEWDEELYLPTAGEEGTVVRVDDDGTVAVHVKGLDEICFPKAALVSQSPIDDSDLVSQSSDRQQSQLRRTSASSLDSFNAPITSTFVPSACIPALESFRNTSFARLSFRADRQMIQSIFSEGPYGKGLILLTVLASMGGFIIGYGQGVTTGVMILLQKHFAEVGAGDCKMLLAISLGMAVLGALSASPLARLSRKSAIIVACGTSAFGSVMLAAAKNKGSLILGYLLLGLGVGALGASAPIYIAEAAPSKVRGSFVTVFSFFHALGQVCGALISVVNMGSSEAGWRYSLGLIAIPAAIQFVGLIFMPDSLLLLAMKGKQNQAKQAVATLRPGCDPDRAVQELQRVTQETSGGKGTFKELLLKHYRIALLGCALQALQQLGGASTITFLSKKIVNAAWGLERTADSIPEAQQVWTEAGVAAVALVASGIAVVLVDRLGRRMLAMGSAFGAAASLCVMAVGVHVDGNILQFAGLVAFHTLYNLGVGCIPWTINAEIYPVKLRAAGSALSSSIHWLTFMTVFLLRDTMVESMGEQGVLWFHAAFLLLSLVFVYFFLPETRHCTLPQCSKLFEKKGPFMSAAAGSAHPEDRVSLMAADTLEAGPAEIPDRNTKDSFLAGLEENNIAMPTPSTEPKQRPPSKGRFRRAKGRSTKRDDECVDDWQREMAALGGTPPSGDDFLCEGSDTLFTGLQMSPQAKDHFLERV